MSYTQFGQPVALFEVDTTERDALNPAKWTLIANRTGSNVQVMRQGVWCNVPLIPAGVARHDGDVMTWKSSRDLWVPASDVNVIGSLSGQRAFFTQDHATALEVRRTWSTLVATKTGSGDMTPYGDHQMTASTSFKVVIDTAGDESSATFKWSNDGGATYTQELQPVASLARFALSDGMYVLFNAGTYVLADQWTWTAIGTASQLYDLKVDTTNSITQVGTRLEIANDSYFALLKTGTSPYVLWDQVLGAQSRLLYNRTLRELGWEDRGVPVVTLRGAAFPNADVELENGSLLLNALTLPTTPAAVQAKFFAFTVGATYRPHWLDESGLNQNMLPLTTKGDLYTFNATTSARLAVGADDTIIMADSAATTGLKWVASATPSTQAFGDAAAIGTADTFTRGDHKHGMPSAAVIATDTIWDAAGDLAVGTGADTAARLAITVPGGADELNVLGVALAGTTPTWKVLFDSTTPAAVSSAGNIGTGVVAARRNHIHAHEAAHIDHDTTWAANGDLIVGTLNDAAAILPAGANNTVLQGDSTAGLSWSTTLTVATIRGSTASGGGLTLQTTSHATKGKITFGGSVYDEVNDRWGFGTVSPAAKLHIEGSDIIMTGGKYLRPNTSDAADNETVGLIGGGVQGVTRGATLLVYGNEASLPGSILFQTGTVTNGNIYFQTAATGRLQLNQTGAVIWVPSAQQSIAVSAPIVANARIVQVSTTTAANMTAVPTIADGTDGQVVTIINTGSNTFTLQDQGTLAGSNLRLSATGIALATRDSIELMYSSAIADWVQTAQTNVI